MGKVLSAWLRGRALVQVQMHPGWAQPLAAAPDPSAAVLGQLRLCDGAPLRQCRFILCKT